jgi:hypothetical protein
MKLPEPKTEGRTRRYEYGSVTQICEIATTWSAGRTTRGRDEGNDLAVMKSSWTANRNAHDSIASLKDAPRDVLGQITTIRERIERRVDLPQTTVRRRRHGLDAGAELDPIAWVQRDPYGWSDTVREYQPKRVVKIGMNLSINAGGSAPQLMARGAAAVALADILSSMGFDVELVAWLCAFGAAECRDMDKEIHEIMVKPSDVPMSLNAAATALCDIGFFRTVVLSAHAKVMPVAPTYGLGRADDLEPQDKKRFDVLIEQDVFDLETAVTRVLEEVRRASGTA